MNYSISDEIKQHIVDEFNKNFEDPLSYLNKLFHIKNEESVENKITMHLLRLNIYSELVKHKYFMKGRYVELPANFKLYELPIVKLRYIDSLRSIGTMKKIKSYDSGIHHSKVANDARMILGEKATTEEVMDYTACLLFIRDKQYSLIHRNHLFKSLHTLRFREGILNLLCAQAISHGLHFWREPSRFFIDAHENTHWMSHYDLDMLEHFYDVVPNQVELQLQLFIYDHLPIHVFLRCYERVSSHPIQIPELSPYTYIGMMIGMSFRMMNITHKPKSFSAFMEQCMKLSLFEEESWYTDNTLYKIKSLQLFYETLLDTPPPKRQHSPPHIEEDSDTSGSDVDEKVLSVSSESDDNGNGDDVLNTSVSSESDEDEERQELTMEEERDWDDVGEEQHHYKKEHRLTKEIENIRHDLAREELVFDSEAEDELSTLTDKMFLLQANKQRLKEDLDNLGDDDIEEKQVTQEKLDKINTEIEDVIKKYEALDVL